MSSVQTPPSPTSSGPTFYRWLILVLGLFVALLVLYRATESGYQQATASQLRKIRVVPPFTLTERSGKMISNSDLAGKIWVADFVYTTCPGPCPLVTAAMAKIQQATAGDSHVQLVSFTVDPTTDTPAVLAKYADSFHADPNKWWFLTGPEKPLYDLIQNGFLQVVQDNRGQPQEPGQFTVTHSVYFVLVDADGDMRGFYKSQDADDCKALLRDIDVLEHEEGL